MTSNLPASVSTVIASWCRENISLSRWVNESPLPWTEILSRNEVARLARRHHMLLRVLALLGRFPEVQRFRGRPIGWRRRDVERWLANQQAGESRDAPRPSNCRQMCLHDRHRGATRCSTNRRVQRCAPALPRRQSQGRCASANERDGKAVQASAPSGMHPEPHLQRPGSRASTRPG